MLFQCGVQNKQLYVQFLTKSTGIENNEEKAHLVEDELLVSNLTACIFALLFRGHWCFKHFQTSFKN